MLSSYLRLGLFCELATWFFIFYFSFGLTAFTGFVAAFIAMAVVRVLIVFLIALIARYHEPSPVELNGLWFRVILQEAWVRLMCWLFLFPSQFGGSKPVIAESEGAQDKPVLLLVHGFVCNHTIWIYLQMRLNAAHWPTATVDLEPVYGSMDQLVECLKRRIDELPLRPLILVCHSMGGLVARRYIQQYGAGRISAVVTLATPHQGTQLARFARLSKNGRQMMVGSEWMRTLEPLPAKVPIISLYSMFDDIVVPAANACLPQYHCIALPPVGHIAMLFTDPAARILLAILSQINDQKTRHDQE